MSSKRGKRSKPKTHHPHTHADKTVAPSQESRRKGSSFFDAFTSFYEKNFRNLIIFLIVLCIFSAGMLIANYIRTGDVIQRDVSLSGGISITIKTTQTIDMDALQRSLSSRFPDMSVNTRSLQISGESAGVIIEASKPEKEAEITLYIESLFNSISEDDISVEIMGSALGKSFFQEMFKSLLVAFLFMGAVFYFYFSDNTLFKFIIIILASIEFIFLFTTNDLLFLIVSLVVSSVTIFIYLKGSIPTLAALFAAFLDLFITLGIITALQVRLTSGGIAAFLMLIGYSIDTSILISTKLVKEGKKDGRSGLYDAMKTGMTMSLAGIAATGISFLLSNNYTLKQIMMILVIGLIINFITCWIGNVAILRYRKNVKA